MIIWSKPAREDLRLIHQHIAHGDTHYIHGVIHKRQHFKPEELQRE